MKRLPSLLLSLMLTLGLPTFATAQSAPPQDAAGQPAPARSSFSDAEIQKFVEIQPDIDKIRTEYSERLVGITDQQEATALQNEAVEKMIEVVEDQGMNVDTYNSIAMTLQSDTTLRQRVEEIMN